MARYRGMQLGMMENRDIEVRWGKERDERRTERRETVVIMGVYDTEYIKISWTTQHKGVHFEVGLTTGGKMTAEMK